MNKNIINNNKYNLLSLYIMLCLTFLIPIKLCGQEEDTADIKARAEWFINQRTFPIDSFPSFGYINAFQQKSQLISEHGYATNAEWESIGPEPAPGGYDIWTGKINFIKYDPTEQNVIYLGAADGGIWKSTNTGVFWNCITQIGDFGSSGDLAIDASTTPHTLYYGSGELLFEQDMWYGNGLYRSTDEGLNWTHIGTEGGLPALTYFYKIAIDPTNNQHLIAAIRTQSMQRTGLYQSSNGGNNWSILISGILLTDCAFAPSGQNAYVVGFRPSLGNAYLISHDHGLTFQDPGKNICDQRSRLTVCEDQPNFGNYLYIITSHNQYPAISIYKSTDYGENFISIPINEYNLNNDFWSIWCLNIKVSPVNPNLFFVCKTRLWKSDDGGQSFVEKNTSHFDYHCIDFDPNDAQNRTVMCGCDGGVYGSSSLGDWWSGYNVNLSIKQLYRLNSDPYNPDIIVAGAQDNGLWRKADPNSKQWTGWGDGDKGTVRFSKVTPNLAIHRHCNNGSQECYSTNSGMDWNCNCSTAAGDCPWLTPITSDPILPNTFYTTRWGVFKSTNVCFNWQPISPDFHGQLGIVDAFTVNTMNPNYMWAVAQNRDRQFIELWHSSDGGQNWVNLQIQLGSNSIPFRYITTITSDPGNPNEIVVCLSGFSNTSNPGNIFRSQDGGYNWFSICGNPQNGGLPDNPVNSIVIYYSDVNTKNYVAGTDIGVFKSSNDGVTWEVIGSSLPVAPCTDLDYNRLFQKLFVSTWGRSAYKLDLGGGELFNNPIMVKDNLVIGGNVNIDYDIIVCSAGKLIIPNTCTIQFRQGKKIIVQDGGQIDASSNNAITLTSQSGPWGGIEFQGSGYGTLRNCTIANAPISVNIDGTGGSGSSNNITIDGCTISEGSIYINSRDNVNVQNTTINHPQDPTYTGININYGNNVNIYHNIINGAQIGLSIANSSPYAAYNQIYSNYPQSPLIGISLNNAYSPTLNNNTITNYITGFDMINSSPTMYQNSSIYDLTNVSGIALNAVYLSSPRLKPSEDEQGNTIWDAGLNVLKVINYGYGMNLAGMSEPIIDYGYNTIYGFTTEFGFPGHCVDIIGTIGDPQINEYYAYCNSWVVTPDNTYFMLDVPVRYIPYDCNPQGGGGIKENSNKIYSDYKPLTAVPPSYSELPSEASEIPPPPIIIDLGNGIFDTIRVTNSSHAPTADQLLYSRAVKQELLGNYNLALSLFQQVVSNYKDSITAINSLRNILLCHDKLHSDTTVYSNLRTYYHNLAQANLNDSTLFMTANELATKVLVRKNQFPSAITEYENVITNSRDSLEILSTELNIIETYMLIFNQGSGNSPQFTGKLTYLKPDSKQDGFRRIREKIRKIVNIKENKVIPKEFKLKQNYPNPFNATTNIEYSIPNNSKVTIKVYDILGRMVKELVNEFKEAGIYTVHFDAGNYASGVYFYRIEAGKFVNTKKMVLIK